MKKTLTILLFLLICSLHIQAQQEEYLNANLLPKVTTPGVADLGKHISVSECLNTGLQILQFLIYTLKYGRMQVLITLSYDTSGVRVTDGGTIHIIIYHYLSVIYQLFMRF